MRSVSAAAILAIAVLCLSGPAPASDLYRWTDEKGNLHVATSLSDVPERYRDQVTTMKADPAPAPAPAPAPGLPSASDTSPAGEPQQPSSEEGGLRRFEVPYKHEGSARRVIIPVTFNDRVTAPMAIDTGSPGMVVSADLAQRLGVFSRDRGTLFTEAHGIGGAALAVLTIIESVSVESARDEFVPTTVTAGLSDEFDGLIGMDFLANYTISIDSRRQVVVFQETPPQPGSRGGHDEDWWRKTFEDFRSVRDLWGDLARSTNLRPGSRSRAVIEFQAREAERLFNRLDMYASDNAVPRHWR